MVQVKETSILAGRSLSLCHISQPIITKCPNNSYLLGSKIDGKIYSNFTQKGIVYSNPHVKPTYIYWYFQLLNYRLGCVFQFPYQTEHRQFFCAIKVKISHKICGHILIQGKRLTRPFYLKLESHDTKP